MSIRKKEVEKPNVMSRREENQKVPKNTTSEPDLMLQAKTVL